MNRRFSTLAFGALGSGFLVMASLEPQPVATVDEAAVDRYLARLSLAGQPAAGPASAKGDPLREAVSEEAARLDRAEPLVTSALASLR